MGMSTWPAVSRFPLTPFAVGTRSATPAALPCRRPGLRVNRPLEDTRQPGQAGRMRLSGRLADVCAELERLAHLEAR